MFNLSYNLSPALRENFRKLDLLRQKILLYPISPTNEIEARWESRIDRIYWLLSFEEILLTKKEIGVALDPQGIKLKSQASKVAARLNSSQNFIKQNWLVSASSPTIADVTSLYRSVSGHSVSITDESLKTTLEYLKATPEHPIIPAAIIHLEVLGLAPDLPYRKTLAVLMSYMFLYKFGYDARELIVLEESLKKDMLVYDKNVKSALSGQGYSLTEWLEYFSGVMIWSLERAWREISTVRSVSNRRLGLNERQKEILLLAENPETQLSNIKIQKLFKVSQVTASRDLAKLATAGLLVARGKGRSTTYSLV